MADAPPPDSTETQFISAAEVSVAELATFRAAVTDKLPTHRSPPAIVAQRGLSGPPVVLLPLDEPLKAGWRTSELWMKLAALALSAAFASGKMTDSTTLALAGMAASVLTAAGYAVTRTWLKTAAVKAGAP